jgi:membrane protein YqaA with SNARE-associated domain
MKNLFKRFKVWCLHWANTKWGVWALFICAFADASFFGLPTPMLFLALALMNIRKIYVYVLYGTLGTLAGALAGYSIGHFAWLNASGEFTGVARFLFDNIPGFSVDVYNKIQILYAKWDFWVLFVAAALPLPFKIFSISSGVFDINLLIFSIATLISQGLKFTVLALLTIKLGPEVKKIFEFNWKPLVIILSATIAVTILILKIF